MKWLTNVIIRIGVRTRMGRCNIFCNSFCSGKEKADVENKDNDVKGSKEISEEEP